MRIREILTRNKPTILPCPPSLSTFLIHPLKEVAFKAVAADLDVVAAGLAPVLVGEVVSAETGDEEGDWEVMGSVELADPKMEDEVTKVEEIVDMLLEDGTRVDDTVVSTVELGVSWELLGCVSAWISEATDVMMPGSSLGRGTSPLTVHPPEAPGQAGGLNVGL